MKKEFFLPQLLRQASLQPAGQDSDLAGLTKPCSARDLAHCSTEAARRLLSYELAKKFGVLPLGVIQVFNRKILSVAVHEQDPADLEKSLRFSTGYEIKATTAPSDSLDEAIFLAYHQDQSKLVESKDKILSQKKHFAADSFNSPAVLPQTQDEVATFLTHVIEHGLAQEASDIYFIPRAKGFRLQLRLHGELFTHEECNFPRDVHQQLIRRIKVLSNLDTTQTRLPQDGSFQMPLASRSTLIRVSTLPTLHGEKAVLRLTGSHTVSALHELGLHQRTLHFIEETCRESSGMLLFCGPTGCGKTTSMYAVLKELSNRSLHLASLEDPVEMELPYVSQTGLQPEVGLDYSKALRALLRQDPDVILVGEIRDKESAQIAFDAALSGHLLLSTVHSASALQVFLRLSRFEIDPLTLAQCLRLVIAQRLEPKLCNECKVIHLLASNQLKADIFQRVGCNKCDYSGYQGRVLTEEALYVNSGLKEIIASGEFSTQTLKSLLSEQNYVSLESRRVELARAGVIGTQD